MKVTKLVYAVRLSAWVKLKPAFGNISLGSFSEQSNTIQIYYCHFSCFYYSFEDTQIVAMISKRMKNSLYIDGPMGCYNVTPRL